VTLAAASVWLIHLVGSATDLQALRFEGKSRDELNGGD
jgi:hypothetical protein